MTGSKPSGPSHTPEGAVSRLQRATLEFVNGTDSPEQGNRERRVFRAAADLAECGTPPAVIVALLETPARDSGLSQSEVEHAVESGIAHAQRGKGDA